MPGWGSWEWVGAGLIAELDSHYHVVTFGPGEAPACDLQLVIKHPASFGKSDRFGQAPSVIYCPIDFYGGPSEIDADRAWLSRCSRILVHGERLRRYFEPYAPVEYMDHHVKFVAPPRDRFQDAGFILWIGVRSNLDPLVAWINEHPLPAELRILTNLETLNEIPSPEQLGIRSGLAIRVENWTPARHLELLAQARAAIEIKGDDFRSRHKPPAKALDFIASGVPLAMNAGSASHEHLARLGFDLASPVDLDRWLSKEYWEETRQFGQAVRELLSLKRIARRFKRVIDEVLAERR